MTEDRYTRREEILDGARDAVMKARNNSYGPPTQDFDRTAGILNSLGVTVNGQPVQSHHVAVIQIAVKLSRIAWSPGHKDSWLDIAGYAACGYECAASNVESVPETPPAQEGVDRVPIGTELLSVEDMARLAIGQEVVDAYGTRYRKDRDDSYTDLQLDGASINAAYVLRNPSSDNGKPAQWARVVA